MSAHMHTFMCVWCKDYNLQVSERALLLICIFQVLPLPLNHEVSTGNIQTFSSHLTENTVSITKAIQLILFSEVIVLYS
jgi:hypothetical protein